MMTVNRATLVPACGVIAIVIGFSNPRCVALDVVANDLIQLTEQSFVQNVFGNQRSDVAARQHAEQSLQVRIDFIGEAIQLTDAQRSKLELAGQGDIHRFFTDYQRVKRSMTFGGIPRDKWQQVWQKTQPLSARYTDGLHGPRSLLAKTVLSTLDADQRTRFATLQKDHDIAIYSDHIRMALAMIDRKVPLTRGQRNDLTDLLVRDTSPPEYYGQTSMHFYVVLGRMSELREKDLKQIFSDTEWPLIKGLMQQGKMIMARLEQQRKMLGE